MARWLRASPDGRLLALQIQHEKGTTDELWEVMKDGSHLRRISLGVSPEIDHASAAWTPDSSYFVFAEASQGKEWLLALRRPLLGLGPESRIRLNPGFLSATEIVSAASGKKLLAIAALRRMEILRFDSKSGGLMPYLAGISADGLAFSRQGDWVAYTSFPDRRLVRSRLDGTERRDLTDGTRRALLPSWSPDGRYIAYMERAGDGPFKIQLISSEGGASQMLLPGSDDEANPTWSPDGNSLIYAGAPWIKGFTQNSTAVHHLDLRTRKEVTLPGSAGLWSPRWSPDGKFLIAETVDSQRLMLFDFSTRTWTPLVDSHGKSLGYTSWSHDSRYVYYNTYLYQRGTIHRVDVSRRMDERVPFPENIDMAVTLGQWFTLAPDDSPLFLRDASVREIFALDLGLP
jgi:Tol biopolymer transport system component